jgi:integrase
MAWIGDREGDFFPGFKSKTKATISMAFTRLMDKAGVPRKVILPGDIEASRSFHSLRHSFTSWLADADIHSDVRQKLTGHSSAGVHAKYSHHDASLARAVKTLPEL